MYDVIVIGGGAAGMLASGVAAEHGARVLLIEQNDVLGKKLYITGKGRCNLTNDCPVDEVLRNIPTGGRFLHSAINGFTPGDTIALFKSLGVALKTERGNRVFPQSDKSSDIVIALVDYMDKNGVFRKHSRALGILAENGQVEAVKSSAGEIKCGAVILATGECRTH